MEILEFGRIVLFVREEKETFGHADGRKEKKYVILSGKRRMFCRRWRDENGLEEQ